MASIIIRATPRKISYGTVILTATPKAYASTLDSHIYMSVTSSGTLSKGRVVAGTIILPVTSVGTFNSPNVCSGVIVLSTTATGSLIINNAIASVSLLSIIAYGTISSPNTLSSVISIPLQVQGSFTNDVALTFGATDAWVVNLATGGHSNYTNFKFNSIFRLGAKYYGCLSTGIYELTGGTDDLTSITWEVETATTTFGVHNRKSIPDVRLTYRTDGDLELTTTADEQKSIASVPLSDNYKNGVITRRIKTAKGLYGTAYSFTITGTGAQTDLKVLEVQPAISQRT